MSALGSDIIVAAIEGYALLGVTRKSEGLKAVRRELSSRWAKPFPLPDVTLTLDPVHICGQMMPRRRCAESLPFAPERSLI